MFYQLDARCIIDYRAYRLEQGIKGSTINHDLFALSGIFKSMAVIDEFHGENPVTSVAVLKEPKTEMSYLTQTEVDLLMSLCLGDYYRIAILLLAAGVKWGRLIILKRKILLVTELCLSWQRTVKGSLFRYRMVSPGL